VIASLPEMTFSRPIRCTKTVVARRIARLASVAVGRAGALVVPPHAMAMMARAPVVSMLPLLNADDVASTNAPHTASTSTTATAANAANVDDERYQELRNSNRCALADIVAWQTDSCVSVAVPFELPTGRNRYVCAHAPHSFCDRAACAHTGARQRLHRRAAVASDFGVARRRAVRVQRAATAERGGGRGRHSALVGATRAAGHGRASLGRPAMRVRVGARVRRRAAAGVVSRRRRRRVSHWRARGRVRRRHGARASRAATARACRRRRTANGARAHHVRRHRVAGRRGGQHDRLVARRARALPVRRQLARWRVCV
jgi:hypothetical protein